MTDKPYKDPEKLAWALHTSDNYSEAAEKLECSEGTISVWRSKLEEELKEYNPGDFDDDVGPDPDVVDDIESAVLGLLDGHDPEVDDELVRVGDFGLVIELTGSVERVAGKDMNPFIALSEHKLTEDWYNLAEEHDVGVIKVTTEGCEVVLDSNVTNGSGLRAILTPEEAGTIDKYRSRAWLQENYDEEDITELAEECSVTPRTLRSKADEFGITH